MKPLARGSLAGVGFLVSAFLLLPGCDTAPSTARGYRERPGGDGAKGESPGGGNAKATENYWLDCADRITDHQKELNEIWVRDLRPEKVASVYRRTAQRLRDVPVNEVDKEVVNHINNVIRGYEEIAEGLENEGLAVLRDEFIPSKGVLGLGLVKLGAERETTGARHRIRAKYDAVREKLEVSERTTIDEMRRRHNLELRPF
jgi:hypothetical protein